MEHYKSWSDLKNWLNNNVCVSIKDRITFFLTSYHKVHNSYGRASIMVDKNEWVSFSWIEECNQERERDKLWIEGGKKEYNIDNFDEKLKDKFDENCTYSNYDFLSSCLEFRNMKITDSLASENYIIKILAIIDKRVGKRTLKKIEEEKAYLNYPDWVKKFYILRLSIQ